MKEEQGKQNRQQYTEDVKTDLDVTEFSVRGVRDGFDKSLPGIHNHVCDDGQCDTKSQNYHSGQHQKEPDGIVIGRDGRDAPQAKIGEPSEQKGQRNLQELKDLEIPAQDENLSQNNDAVPDDEPLAQRKKVNL